MKPTDGILVALQFATFEDEDLRNMVQEVIAQLDSDLDEADYTPSSTSDELYDKFDAFMKDFINDNLKSDDEDEDSEDSDDEDEDDEDENDDDEDEDNEDEDDEDEVSGWNEDDDEDSP